MGTWDDKLRAADTVHLDEQLHCSAQCQPLSPPAASLSSKLQSRSFQTGREADVSIYIRGTCFRLHKATLSSKSGYLRRQLSEVSQITLSLNITPETFTLVADFCYGNPVVISPFNVAALWTAAELLEMTEVAADKSAGQSLRETTEAYFHKVVVVNSELVLIVLKSCLSLLPEAETGALLVSRCVESLDLAGYDGKELDECIEEMVGLPPDEFMIVAEAFQYTCENHDMLYRIVDLYVKVHGYKISEEKKTMIYNVVDCDKLSQEILIHVVQNPRLPLRFMVRAMLMEHLNTRRAIFTANANGSPQAVGFPSLGSIMRRDAAAKEAAQIKAEMDDTSTRIRMLERELAAMKKLLLKSERQSRKLQEIKETNAKEIETSDSPASDSPKHLIETCNSRQKPFMEPIPEELHEETESKRIVADPSRSLSFHYGARESKVTRGERGSVSFSSVVHGFGSEGPPTGRSSCPSPSCKDVKPIKKSSTKASLISRLRNKFRVSKSSSRHSSQIESPKVVDSKRVDSSGYELSPEIRHGAAHTRSKSLG